MEVPEWNSVFPSGFGNQTKQWKFLLCHGFGWKFYSELGKCSTSVCPDGDKRGIFCFPWEILLFSCWVKEPGSVQSGIFQRSGIFQNKTPFHVYYTISSHVYYSTSFYCIIQYLSMCIIHLPMYFIQHLSMCFIQYLSMCIIQYFSMCFIQHLSMCFILAVILPALCFPGPVLLGLGRNSRGSIFLVELTPGTFTHSQIPVLG